MSHVGLVRALGVDVGGDHTIPWHQCISDLVVAERDRHDPLGLFKDRHRTVQPIYITRPTKIGRIGDSSNAYQRVFNVGVGSTGRQHKHGSEQHGDNCQYVLSEPGRGRAVQRSAFHSLSSGGRPVPAQFN